MSLKNKIISFLVSLGILGGAVIGADLLILTPQEKIDKLPDNLKIKTVKKNILLNEDYNEIKFKEDGDIEVLDTVKKYYYLGDKLQNDVLSVNKKIYTEDVEKRTPNARVYKNGNEEIMGINSWNKYYEKDGEWYGVKFSTTTIEAYELQTTNLISKIKDRFIARADSANYTSNAGDGVVGRVNEGDTWVQLHGGAGTEGSSASANFAAGVRSGLVSNFKIIRRSILSFDTSGLPDDADISAVTVDIYSQEVVGNVKLDNPGISPTWAIYGSTPDDRTALDSEDYGNVQDTILSDEITYANWGASDSDKNTFTFNEDGIDAIDVAGFTDLSLRESEYEGDNDEPTMGDTSRWILVFAYVSTGAGTDPYMTVTYTSGAAPAEEAKQIKIPPQIIIY